MTVQNGSVVTPGGYKITPNAPTKANPNSWTITGPDCNSSFVHGDPHVDESTGGKFSFASNANFVLPDGTTIHVNTTPGKLAGSALTSSLDIVNGQSHVAMTGFGSTQTATIGPVTNDGQQVAPTFAGDQTFTMGKNAADWMLGGQDVTGSNPIGTTINLANGTSVPSGAPVASSAPAASTAPAKANLAGVPSGISNVLNKANAFGGASGWGNQLKQALQPSLNSYQPSTSDLAGFNPFANGSAVPSDTAAAPASTNGAQSAGFNSTQQQQGIEQALQALIQLIEELAQWSQLQGQVSPTQTGF